MKACTCEQMHKIDADAERIGGIPSIVLMENAALACVEELKKIGIEKKRIAVFCGKGNNGGDGLAIARHLHLLGADVTVCLVCGNDYKGDALINYEITHRMNVPFTEDEEQMIMCAEYADIIVDAIFGTGVRGQISGTASKVINAINASRAFVLAVDIPSGANGDTGEVCGVCTNADVTVTFGAYKLGMVKFPASAYMGRIAVNPISIPPYIMDGQRIRTNITDIKTASAMLPKRCENSHKGDYGKVLVIGGSTGMMGAPCMAAQAAIVSGAGLVTAAVPASLNNIAAMKLTECMTLPLHDTGGVMSFVSMSTIDEYLKRTDAVLFGPGIGRSEDIRLILENIISISKIPLIIDADGLFALAEDISILKDAKCDIILTPHTGEMARLCGLSAEEIEKDRLGISAKFASENNVTLVLKGHHTIVTAADGTQYINITGNSGMATGGSGDVLGGMICSFMSRTENPMQAAALAVYLHGAAGDIERDKKGASSVTACGIINSIPEAIKSVEAADTSM